jgi:hypothetical protein
LLFEPFRERGPGPALFKERQHVVKCAAIIKLAHYPFSGDFSRMGLATGKFLKQFGTIRA